MNTMLAIAIINFAVWTYLLLARGGFWLANCRIDPTLPSPTIWPEVTVIIPARNEADILESTLPSLLEHDYPVPLRIILVDDRSEDATAIVASRIAERLHASERLTVINGRSLPSGWKGKVWAMQCGLEQVGASRYILFTDADIAYDQGAITRLVAQAEAKNLVLTSLMVRLRCRSMAERCLIPAFVYFFQLLYPFNWVNQPRRPMAAAAGGCMLVRQDALQQAGGLAPIRSALIDDCALARLLKPQGPIWLGLTQQVHSLRAYPHLDDIRAMVSRSAYDQLGYSPLNLACSLVGMMFTFIAPLWLACFATGPAQTGGIVCWLAMMLSFFPITRFYGRSPLQGLALPLIAACYMGFTLNSAWQYKTGRGGLWKGRVQAANAKSAGAQSA